MQLHGAVGLVALALAGTSAAATLQVAVTDEHARPIGRVAVYAKPKNAPAVSPGVPRASAVMDQHDHRFVPHLLVVQTGTDVQFPNTDSVSHHVYSFSPAKHFELGLYKGNVYPPVRFNEPGVVVLGCNIHDEMLGYIFVVDTPYFALTDARGVATLEDLPDGEYDIEAWTPRARPAGLPPATKLTLGRSPAMLDLRVSGKLAPDHDGPSSSLTWENY